MDAARSAHKPALSGDDALVLHRRMLADAESLDSTPFDYIVVGSGAGGGPLAARLAEAGKTVLVVEAGHDPAAEGPAGGIVRIDTAEKPAAREVYQVPGYHAAATEDPQMSWMFSVRHYENDAAQKRDSKYVRAHDPLRGADEPWKGGIQYPRASALGGCTAHHAMIVVKPNDKDWNDIAAVTGDASWRAETMQGYFARLENCLYYKTYQGVLRKVFWFYALLCRLAAFINPRWQLDRGGHGTAGWQKTSFIDPGLIWKIAKGDRTFRGLLLRVVWFLIREPGRLRAALGSFLRLQIVQLLDPNFGAARPGVDAQVSFIPIGTDGARRTGVRERLLNVLREDPRLLVVVTDALVTRVIFRQATAPVGRPATASDRVPQACGIEVAHGVGLYSAGRVKRDPRPERIARYYAKREIVIAGGAFNTPQLLMLSGIGNSADLARLEILGPRDAVDRPVAPIVNLQGVGRNLQDRYEVSVITRTPSRFSTLDGVSFLPGDPNDPALRQWRATKDGLYGTNGGAIAFFRNTPLHQKQADDGPKHNPDLFIFGAPAAFRGYYWDWSKELLRADRNAPEDQRDLWSWILLKAYTNNNGGELRLWSHLPYVQPEINLHSFEEGPDGYEADVAALAKGVAFVRRVNASFVPDAANVEIQPGKSRADDSADLRQWIQDEAWGHHACGTCRMGSDPWRADVAELQDQGAVLDSQLRVHGVRGLRVVDASVFPRIPGYFIVTPVFMIGEKAADLLLADSAAYPARLRAAEAAAVANRRSVARGDAPAAGGGAAAPPPATLPQDTVGLALSGGGIRSATFCLGVLQGLACKGRLRCIDFVSTVSGGGYIGVFLGRLYTRIAKGVANPAERVEAVLAGTHANELWWLRTHANYLLGEGRSDLQSSLGVIWRNLLAVHFCIGTLALGLFGLLRWVGGPAEELACPTGWQGVLTCSPWWWLPGAIAVLAVFPVAFGFWLAPQPGAKAAHSFLSLATWMVLLAGAIYGLQFTRAQALLAIAILSLLLAWVWQEAAHWRMPASVGAGNAGVVVRNRLTRGLGVALFLLGSAAIVCILDSLARAASVGLQGPVVGGMLLINALLPVLRMLWDRFGSARRTSEDQTVKPLLAKVRAGAVAFLLAGFLLFAVDVLAHAAFNTGARVGLWTIGVALATSLAVGRATGFLNLSSLQSIYAARLARTFLGASNPARVYSQGTAVPQSVDTAHPDDDLPFDRYHPELIGGPLHLINVCVNESVDALSGRQLDRDKALPMCVGPEGVSVGVRYHALWERADDVYESWVARRVRAAEGRGGARGAERTALRALPVAADPEAFHVLAQSKQQTVAVETLRLSQWMAISGAAYTTGAGRFTSLPRALLRGLLNVRLGYWWDTRIDAGERPSRYPPTFLRRLTSAPGWIFRTQQMLLNEWRGYFPGPGARLWYLSDGGHFENSGLYELIRRRVAFMIAVDADEDPNYRFGDLALLVRRARLDLKAEFTWIDPTAARENGAQGWMAVNQATGAPGVPQWISEWLNPDALGPVFGIAQAGKYEAALARIEYRDDSTDVSWLVVLKACLVTRDAAFDLRSYSVENRQFPNQPTSDQFLDDDQWESYRLLGHASGRLLFKDR